jgi:hypothetical protein
VNEIGRAMLALLRETTADHKGRHYTRGALTWFVAVRRFEIRDDAVVVIDDDVAIDQDGYFRLTGNGDDFPALRMRNRHFDGIVVEAQLV